MKILQMTVSAPSKEAADKFYGKWFESNNDGTYTWNGSRFPDTDKGIGFIEKKTTTGYIQLG